MPKIEVNVSLLCIALYNKPFLLLTGGYYVQHIPVFMRWLKYLSFMYYGFRLLLKVQYSVEDLFECESQGGCRPLQTSPSFDTVNLKGGFKEVWVPGRYTIDTYNLVPGDTPINNSIF